VCFIISDDFFDRHAWGTCILRCQLQYMYKNLQCTSMYTHIYLYPLGLPADTGFLDYGCIYCRIFCYRPTFLQLAAEKQFSQAKIMASLTLWMCHFKWFEHSFFCFFNCRPLNCWNDIFKCSHCSNIFAGICSYMCTFCCLVIIKKVKNSHWFHITNIIREEKESYIYIW